MFEPGTIQLRFPHAMRLLVSTPWVVWPPLLGRTLWNATFEPRTRIVTTGTLRTLVLPPSWGGSRPKKHAAARTINIDEQHVAPE